MLNYSTRGMKIQHFLA